MAGASSIFKEDAPLLIGGLCILGAIVYAARGKSSTSSNATVSYAAIPADAGIVAQQTAIETGRQGLVGSLFQGVFALDTAQAADNASVTNTKTAADSAAQQATIASQTALGVADTAGQTTLGVASLQEQAAEASIGAGATTSILGSNNALKAVTVQANDQLSATQAQASASESNSFWNGLFGVAGGALKLFSAPATGGLSLLGAGGLGKSAPAANPSGYAAPYPGWSTDGYSGGA